MTIRRGGVLTDADHRLLAVWAAACAQHVLHHFEPARPGDPRPRQAVDLCRAWARGEITMTQARTAGGHANAAARDQRLRNQICWFAVRLLTCASPDPLFPGSPLSGRGVVVRH